MPRSWHEFHFRRQGTAADVHFRWTKVLRACSYAGRNPMREIQSRMPVCHPEDSSANQQSHGGRRA